MNIVYFLGNGFDKAQGLKTSYPEFYEYLDKQEGSALLQNLKSDIRKDTKLWADMHLGNSHLKLIQKKIFKIYILN